MSYHICLSKHVSSHLHSKICTIHVSLHFFLKPFLYSVWEWIIALHYIITLDYKTFPVFCLEMDCWVTCVILHLFKGPFLFDFLAENGLLSYMYTITLDYCIILGINCRVTCMFITLDYRTFPVFWLGVPRGRCRWGGGRLGGWCCRSWGRGRGGRRRGQS